MKTAQTRKICGA